MSEADEHAPGPLIVDVSGAELTAGDRMLLAHPAVGGAILFAGNYRDPGQLAALTADMRAARADLIIVADTEGGRVQRFRSGFTKIPPMRALGDWWQRDPDAAIAGAREIAWLMADELRAAGVDLPLAPVVDIEHGRSTVIGDRAFADSGHAVAQLATAFAAGLAEAGSAATAKHFPGHGAVAADSHTRLPVDVRPWSALAAEMQPYRPLLAAGVASVMMAHVRYPSVDPAPASVSHRWITDILRGQLGFDGCVFCDDLSMAAAAAAGDFPARVRAALAAGCDFLPVCHDRGAVELALAAALAGDSGASRARRAAFAGRIAANARAAAHAGLSAAPRRGAARRLCRGLGAATRALSS